MDCVVVSDSLVDVLSKQTIPKTVVSRCAICGDGASYDDNLLIECSWCKVKVHNACSSAGNLDGKGYLCRPCALMSANMCKEIMPTENRRCEVCPNVGGALVEVEGSNYTKWAHTMCAIWIPELWFKEPSTASMVCGLTSANKVLKDRFTLRCCVCNTKNRGACVQCACKKCFTAFHVTCALATGMHLRYNVDENGDVRFDCFCRQHEPYHVSDAPTCLEELNMKFLPTKMPKKKANPPKKPGNQQKVRNMTRLKRGRPRVQASNNHNASNKKSNIITGKPLYGNTKELSEYVEREFFTKLTFDDVFQALNQVSYKDYFSGTSREDGESWNVPNLLGYDDNDFTNMETDSSWLTSIPKVFYNGIYYALNSLSKENVREPYTAAVCTSGLNVAQLTSLEMGTEVAILFWKRVRLVEKHGIPSRELLFIPYMFGVQDDLQCVLLAYVLDMLKTRLPSALLGFIQVPNRLTRYVGWALDAHVVAPAREHPGLVTLCMRLQDFDFLISLERLRPDQITVKLKKQSNGTYTPVTRPTLAELEQEKLDGNPFLRGSYQKPKNAARFESQPVDFPLWRDTMLSPEAYDMETVEDLESQLNACIANNRTNINMLMSRIYATLPAEIQERTKREEIEEEYKQLATNLAAKAHDTIQKTLQDQNAHCLVCLKDDSYHGNLIVICDGCDKGYHQKCIQQEIDLSSNEWYCMKCDQDKITTTTTVQC